MNDVRVKICGLTTPEDARVAGDLGADYLGMILSQGFKRSILPDRAVDIELAVDAPLVAVFVDEPLSEVERIGRMIGASVIQLHGEEGARLRRGVAREGRLGDLEGDPSEGSSYGDRDGPGIWALGRWGALGRVAGGPSGWDRRSVLLGRDAYCEG